MENNFLLIVNLVVLAYILFDTDALAEWARLLRIKFLKSDEYFSQRLGEFPYLTYADFIEAKYGQRYFLIRLLTCPICLTTWCNIFIVVISSGVKLLWLGPNILLTWVLYYFLRRLIKKFNE